MHLVSMYCIYRYHFLAQGNKKAHQFVGLNEMLCCSSHYQEAIFIYRVVLKKRIPSFIFRRNAIAFRTIVTG